MDQRCFAHSAVARGVGEAVCARIAVRGVTPAQRLGVVDEPIYLVDEVRRRLLVPRHGVWSVLTGGLDLRGQRVRRPFQRGDAVGFALVGDIDVDLRGPTAWYADSKPLGHSVLLQAPEVATSSSPSEVFTSPTAGGIGSRPIWTPALT